MKKFTSYIIRFLSQEKSGPFYPAFLGFLILSVAVNYSKSLWGGQRFEHFVFGLANASWQRFLIALGLFVFPYLVAVGLLRFRNEKLRLGKAFWLSLLIFGCLIGLRRGTNAFTFIDFLFSPLEWRFLYSVFQNLYTLVIALIPLCLVYFFWHKKTIGHFYGIRIKNTSFTPYFIMLLGMIPLILGASFTKDFLNTYPTFSLYRGNTFADEVGISYLQAFVLYEVAYILDYLPVELFFRGYLIFVMSKYLGRDVVLPMVAAYVWLHFGKPLGETIGSFFGGYILGVIALYSRNIWGGVFVHMGVAFLMDLFAYWQVS